jgi:hypothetical protein
MEKAGVKTSLFAQNFGPALDTFDAAVIKYDSARKTRGRADPVILQLATSVRTASGQLMIILAEYNENLTYLAEHATDPRQKEAIGEASAWTLSFAETIRQMLLKLPQ